jgi:predicted nucleic acid-binding protein
MIWNPIRRSLPAALAVMMGPVDVHFGWRRKLADPDDEMVLDAAVNGRADVLVTHNIRDFLQAAPRFGLSVLRPGALVERMKT